MLNIYAACADDELMPEDTTNKLSKSFSDKSGHGKRHHNYIPNGKKTTYLSNMNQIMKLRAMVENG